MEDGIIDGALTAVVQVPDLRVGDVLVQTALLESRPMRDAGERNGGPGWNGPPVAHAADLAQGCPTGAWPLCDGTLRYEWRREDNPTPDARAYAALRLVQDELRHVPLSVGQATTSPDSPPR